VNSFSHVDTISMRCWLQVSHLHFIRIDAIVHHSLRQSSAYTAAVVLATEPTLCTPITGHKGGVGLEFKINGVAAHSSKPHLGKNALVAAAVLKHT
jgi:acetylornithine deacetylase/succinyl-diaminopimelate desuccinylase-like protein